MPVRHVSLSNLERFNLVEVVRIAFRERVQSALRTLNALVSYPRLHVCHHPAVVPHWWLQRTSDGAALRDGRSKTREQGQFILRQRTIVQRPRSRIRFSILRCDPDSFRTARAYACTVAWCVDLSTLVGPSWRRCPESGSKVLSRACAAAS